MSDTRCDHEMMSRAMILARRGYYSARPNPRVGCVIAQGSKIVGEGFHLRAGEPHAEINALRDAGAAAADATAYVTLEPCCHHGRTPPCTQALIDAGISRVVYAAGDPNPKVAGQGAEKLRQAGMTVVGGLLAGDAEQLNAGFFKRMRDGIPKVVVKIAMTADAKIALSNGESQWITSAAARADVQEMRAAAGAIVTGSGTVAADDPSLTVRDKRFNIGERQPLRVILDSGLRSSADRKIFDEPATALIYTNVSELAQIQPFEQRGVAIETLGLNNGGVDIAAALRSLATREINDVLVEAGPRVTASFIASGMVDEIVVYVAPKLFGHGSRDGFSIDSPASVDTAQDFDFHEVRRVGPDLRVTMRPIGEALKLDA